MKNFCVFCGEIPKEKNKEHIIPKWLIALTGDPNRKAFFGFNFESDKRPIRTYSFNSFSFPACSACNNSFSDLEGNAQHIIKSILGLKEISDLDFNSLLDWFDKVRVGLWLGMLCLSKNVTKITPNYYIKTRMHAADRLLFIYRLSTSRSRINFIGTESPSFLYIPSSFALIVNNFYFFNVSRFNLCDRRLGFPFGTEIYYMDSNYQINTNFVKGLERKYFPVIRETYLPNCTKLFQPIFSRYKNIEGVDKLYDTKYVRDNSIDWNNGIGKVFHEEDSKAKPYPTYKTTNWLPLKSHNPKNCLPIINKQVYDFQVDVIKSASLDKLSDDKKLAVKKHINDIKSINDLMLDFYNKQYKRFEL